MTQVLYKKVAIDAAVQAGRFIRGSVGRIQDISYKGKTNLVTDVDKKAEAMIIRKIVAAFPDHSILSEEGRPRERSSVFKWLIDPLDGTTNFVHAFPFFSVSIGLEKDGAVVLGVVYDPMRDELFTAQKGAGAYLNNKRIKVSDTKRLSESLLATGFAYGVKEAADDNIANFRDFLMQARAIRRAGSAALDFCYVACGRFDGYWELDLNPWDCAAGTLLAREAGGKVSRHDGSAYSHYDKEVLASNGRIHHQMVNVLTKKA